MEDMDVDTDHVKEEKPEQNSTEPTEPTPSDTAHVKEEKPEQNSTERTEPTPSKIKSTEILQRLLSVSESYSKYMNAKLKEELQNESRDKSFADNTNIDGEKVFSKANRFEKPGEAYFKGNLHPYQKEGVQWLRLLYQNSINGILADEMGLGKTIQVIALICQLTEKKVRGPYLVVGPLSVIKNWQNEFARFAPGYPTVVFHAAKEERQDLYPLVDRKYEFHGKRIAPVVITSFSTLMNEEHFLGRFDWQYIIVDEGQRIKNYECKLARQLQAFKSQNRLILTGTPLQNNITELWSLCHFLMPQLFKNVNDFTAVLALADMQDAKKLLQKEAETSVITKIKHILSPFMLRRLKTDVFHDMVPKKSVLVYCPMSEHQKRLYKYVLERDISRLQGKDASAVVDVNAIRSTRPKTSANDKKKDHPFEIESVEDGVPVTYKVRLTMNNPMFMLRKIASHPYLVHFPLVKDEDRLLVTEKLITQSGKLKVLDVMLPKLKRDNHKVLLFSTMTMVLDLVEEFLIYRNYTYRRLDGSNKIDQREKDISDFNADDDIFIFMVSTRAGGTGINLYGADTVIFLDRDWNPQVDLQAEDRSHRIGQTKPVMVYTLVAQNTIDEKILEVGHMKKLFGKVIISDGHFTSMSAKAKNTMLDSLLELKKIIDSIDADASAVDYSDEDLEGLLDRSDLYHIMAEQKIANKEN